MKTILITIILTLCSLGIYSQSTGKTFYLKNGSVVTGIVTEEVPGVQYTVKTSDGNVFVFKADEIEKITLDEEETQKPKTDPSAKGLKFFSQNGFILAGMFTEDYSSYNMAISTINGVSINNTIQLGLGLEYQIIEYGSYIPIYLDAQLNFSPTPKTLFVNLSGGMAISGAKRNVPLVNIITSEPFEKSITYESGFMGRVGFGYKTDITDNLGAVLGINYTALSYKSNSYLYADQYLNIEGIYSIVGVKLGVEF